MKKRSVKKLIIILIIAIIIIFTVILIIRNKKCLKVITIEVGDHVPVASDYIKNIKNMDIKWNKKIRIDDDGRVYSQGSFYGTIKEGFKKFKVTLVVADTTSPIISGYEDIIVNINDDIDLTNNITVQDNSKEKIIPTVEGKYNLTEVGEYNLKYIACDSTNNCSSEDFILTVVEDKDSNKYNLKYVNGILIVNKSYPVPEDYVPENLVTISGNATAVDYVKDAFLELVNDAESLGLNIYASTAYRSYSFQKALYTNYLSRDGQELADTYSARPGYSEHQTGLAIDCNTVNSEFNDTKEAKWLSDNAYKYGFIIRFPDGKSNETGYKYESWHIRYVGKELAEQLYNDGDWITLEKHFNLTSEYSNKKDIN